jgi:hypothetical protein
MRVHGCSSHYLKYGSSNEIQFMNVEQVLLASSVLVLRHNEGKHT